MAKQIIGELANIIPIRKEGQDLRKYSSSIGAIFILKQIVEVTGFQQTVVYMLFVYVCMTKIFLEREVEKQCIRTFNMRYQLGREIPCNTG